MKLFLARIFGSYYVLATLALFGVWIVNPHSTYLHLQSNLAPVAIVASICFVTSRKYLWDVAHIPSTIRPFLANIFGSWYLAASIILFVLLFAFNGGGDPVIDEMMTMTILFTSCSFIISRLYLMSWQAKARKAITNTEANRQEMANRSLHDTDFSSRRES